MKRLSITLITLLCLQPRTESGNKKPEYKGPQEKNCVAPQKGQCTVSLSDTKQGVARTATCTAMKGSKCKVRLNAIEELPKIDVKTAAVKDLGKISKDTTFDAQLPQKEGEFTLYKFVPTAGDFANKEIFFLIFKTVNPVGSRLHGKTALDMYRYLSGDKPGNWVKMGEFESDIPTEKLDIGVTTVKPDGTVLIPSPIQGVPPVAMAVGAKAPTS
jgi:hypothetical protein